MQSLSESLITKTMESQVENQNNDQSLVGSLQEQILPLEKSNPNADLVIISPVKENISEEDKTFVQQFKQRRKQLGLSQADVGLALGSINGKVYTSRTICCFENLRLPASNIRKLKPILQKWLENQSYTSPIETELSETDKTFVEQFKQRRKQLGYSQADVGLSLGLLYGNMYTKATLSHFENLRIPASNIEKLKPILQKWLEKTESDQTTKREKTQSNQNMKRKKMQSTNPGNPAEGQLIGSLQEEISPLNKKSKPNADEVFVSPVGEELSDSEKNFVEQFKQRRKQLGFTQAGVGLALGPLYGNTYNYKTIYNFENLRLPVNNMRKLKPILQMWLEKSESDQDMK